MAATHIRRWDPATSSSEAFLQSNDILPGHPEEMLIVIDWISGSVGTSVGGTCTFTLADLVNDSSNTSSLSSQIYSFSVQVAAGEKEPIHLTFPGGMPLKRQQSLTTSILRDTSSGQEVLGGDVTLETSGSALTSGALFFGFHMERTAARR